jgi:hypothetical protein
VSAQLDLDDSAAGNPLAEAELRRLRRVEAAAWCVARAWADGWDCSESPGHRQVNACIGALCAALDTKEPA